MDSLADHGQRTIQLLLVLQFLEEHLKPFVFLRRVVEHKGQLGGPAQSEPVAEFVAYIACGGISPSSDFCWASALPRTDTDTRAWWRSRSCPPP